MDEGCSSATVIDVQNLQNFLRDDPDHCWASSNVTHRRTLINRVSQQLRGAHKDAFDPIVVSIRPHHRGKHSFQTMEMRKWRCLDYFLEVGSTKNLDDLLKGLRKVYPVAKSYYTDEINITSSKLLQMLLLDGCFVLLALCKIDFISSDRNLFLLNDNMNPTDPWEYDFLKADLMLVENQIPFVVIERVYELITGEVNGSTQVEEQIINFVEQHLLNIPKVLRISSERPISFHNLLHLCHMYLRPTENHDYIAMQMHESTRSVHQWHRATDYHVAGLQFQEREFDENSPHSLLDVRFSDNEIEIPQLLVDENITTILTNLIAFEQMNPRFGNDITAYIIFMSTLIRDAEDVNLFVSRGIIKHHFQSEEEVARMFMELSLGVEFDLSGSYYLKNICQSLGEFYQSRTKWWKGWLR